MIRSAARAAALALLLVATGCGEVGSLAERYRVEKVFYTAQRAEAAVMLGRQRPDSTALLKLRERYLLVSKEAPPPYVRGTSATAVRVGREIARTVGHADLQAARLAVQANRPDLALAQMAQIASAPGTDSLVRREAQFFRVATLRQYNRLAEAIAVLHEILAGFQPSESETLGLEDPLLSVPEAIARLRAQMGETAAAKSDMAAGVAYYRGLLEKPHGPVLQAQIRTRIVKLEVEMGDWSAAMSDLAVLEKLIAANPPLQPLLPEVRYSQAKVTSMTDKSRVKSVTMLDQVARDFPKSPFAPRALLESGLLLEAMGDYRGALERYRVTSVNYAGNFEFAPTAAFRRAVLTDKLGDWDAAKGLYESIPVRYPDTQAAVESPIAIVRHYVVVGEKDASRTALQRAVSTYQELIARDTTSTFGPIYRWSIVRCYNTLGDWAKALDWIDRMAIKDMGHPLGAEALLAGGKIATTHGLKERARGYLVEFLAYYPASPVAPDVKRELAQHGGSPGAAPGTAPVGAPPKATH